MLAKFLAVPQPPQGWGAAPGLGGAAAPQGPQASFDISQADTGLAPLCPALTSEQSFANVQRHPSLPGLSSAELSFIQVIGCSGLTGPAQLFLPPALPPFAARHKVLNPPFASRLRGVQRTPGKCPGTRRGNTKLLLGGLGLKRLQKEKSLYL